jgi:hypothetical protein
MILIILISVLIIVLLIVHRDLSKNSEKSSIIDTPFFKRFETMLFEDGNDQMWSATRTAFIFTTLLSNITLWFGIVYLIIQSNTFPIIPDTIVVLYGVANSIASLTKVIQKKQERILSETEINSNNGEV